MKNDPNPALPFALKAAILENADRLGLKAGATPDLVARLVKAGVALTGDRLTMPCGRDAISYTIDIIKPGFDDLGGGYLFAEAAPPPPKPKPAPAAAKLDTSTPVAAARARATRIEMVTAKLALANGEDV